MNVMEILNGPAGTILGWTLIHLLWQATAVALILGAIRTLWKGASSNARYTTAILALATVLVLPGLTFAHLWNQQTIPAATTGAIEPAAGISMEFLESTNEASPVAAKATESLISMGLPWLVGLWMLGVALLTARLVVRTAWTSRLTRNRVIEVEGSWHRVVERMRKKLGIGQRIEIFESSMIEVPTVVGWIKPVILVPTSVFTGLTYRQIETILAHELAHVRRFDALVNFLQSVIETLFFYHPAVWWISGRIRIEREHCCDDVAIAVCGDRVAYAKALTFLEETRGAVPVGAVAASGGSLLDRIRRIAGVEERDRKAPSIAALVILVMLGGATVWAVSAPDQENKPDKEVVVDDSGWWFVTPPDLPEPPEPSMPPSAPDVAWLVEPPAPPAAPDAPEPPEVPYFDIDLVAPALAAFDHDLSILEIPTPVIPAAPAAPMASPSGIAVVAPEAPPSPPTPSVPMIVSAAPLADMSFSVQGDERDNDRKISDDLTVDDLIRLRAVGVTTEYLKTLKAMGYTDLTIGEVVSLRGVGVTPEYIRAMKKEFGEKLTTRELISLRGVGVTPEWVSSIESFAGKQLTVKDAIRLRGVGVNPEWIGTMSRALGESLTIEDAVRLRGVGVSQDYIRELEKRGIPMPSPEDLVRLRGVGVSPEYIDEMRSAGLGELKIEDLIRLRGVGVSPGYIDDLTRAGLKPLDLETVVRLRGVGVSPSYVGELTALGYSKLDTGTLVRLRGVGVTSEYIKGLRDAGLDVSSVSDLVRLRGVGVTPDYVRELRDAGLENLTIDKLIRLRSAGVDADFVRDMKN